MIISLSHSLSLLKTPSTPLSLSHPPLLPSFFLEIHAYNQPKNPCHKIVVVFFDEP